MFSQKANWIEQVLPRANGHNSKPVALRIRQGEVRNLPRDGRRLRIISGEAWLTMDGRDHILEAGQALVLGRGREKALVSPTNGSSLRLEIG